jgi:hypothetical protein
MTRSGLPATRSDGDVAFCRAGGFRPPDLRGPIHFSQHKDQLWNPCEAVSDFRPFLAAGALGPRGLTPRLGRPSLSCSTHHFAIYGALLTIALVDSAGSCPCEWAGSRK